MESGCRARNAMSAGTDLWFKTHAGTMKGFRLAMFEAAADAALQGAALCSAVGEVSLRLLSQAAHSAADSGSKVGDRRQAGAVPLTRLLAEPRLNNSVLWRAPPPPPM